MKSTPRPLTISVIIPSWKRPDFLKQCLLTLQNQNYEFEVEFLVVLRPEDTESIEVVEQMREIFDEHSKSLRLIWTDKQGIVKALREGFVHSKNEIVAVCDDDAKYPKDWLQNISKTFTSEYVGGVGGPIKEGGEWQGTTNSRQVAHVSLLGRITSKFRAEPKFSSIIAADLLPGANMSYRRNLLTTDIFDTKLDHPGLAPGIELLIGWSVRNQGYSLAYNPNCVVEHFSAPWVDSSRVDKSKKFEAYGINMHYVFAKCAPIHQLFFYLPFSIVIGNRMSPGLVLVLLGKISHKSMDVTLTQSLRIKFDGTRWGFAARKSGK